MSERVKKKQKNEKNIGTQRKGKRTNSPVEKNQTQSPHVSEMTALTFDLLLYQLWVSKGKKKKNTGLQLVLAATLKKLMG